MMNISDFFTWAVLGTYAGAVLFTTVVTQLLKGVSFIEKIPTRLFAYFVALLILLASYFFTTTTWAASEVALCFVNAAVVSLAANGAFDAISNTKKV